MPFSPNFHLKPISLAVIGLLAGGFFMNATHAATDTDSPGMPAEVHFNPRFLHTGGQPVDVSRFSKSNVALPGRYNADVNVNGAWIGRFDVTLRATGNDGQSAQPCFDRDLLERIGVNLAKLTPEATARLAQADACVALPNLVDGASAEFDPDEQSLNIGVPQIAMNRGTRGYVDPRYWDDGITAARLGYNANVYRTSGVGQASTQAYLGVDAGLNIGAWRLRHSGSFSQGTQSGAHYQGVQTVLQRAFAPLKSEFVIGDSFTDGLMFDSVGFRGVQLATDDRMFPDSQRGYAPIIHGIANSNAHVQIRQNGNLIYDTTVPPGPFEIDDLYPTGYGGDLEVTVTEADGSQRVSKVPFAAPVNSVREGVTRYSFTAGQYRNPSVDSKPMLAQGTVQHGFSNLVTGYGGATAAEDYVAAVGGLALNTAVGGFGFDVTYASTRLQHQADQHGTSFRLSYSKLVAPTDTNISIGAYRYSSGGYLDLQDAMATLDADHHGLTDTNGVVQRTRGRLELTVNQALPAGYGNLYISGSTQNYWGRGSRDTQFQFGYNNAYRNINYGISASRQLDPVDHKWDNQVMLTLAVPLGHSEHSPYVSVSTQHTSSGESNAQEMLTGTLGKDNALTYGLNSSQNVGANSNSTSAGANASYQSPYARLSGNTSWSPTYTQNGASISGGLVAYSGGVAFTPSIGETTAIVEAPDAKGARVTNGSGLEVDRWGHALVTSLTPYARNQVEIDPKGLPINVEMKSTSQQVAPTAGAIVKLKFDTENKGRAVLLHLKSTDGKLVPFGSEVFDASGSSVGTVAQSGRVIVHGIKSDTGALSVKWGDQSGQACSVTYVLPKKDNSDDGALTAVDAVCETGGSVAAAQRAGQPGATGVTQ